MTTNIVFLQGAVSAKETILNQTQEANVFVLHKLEELITQYNLSWAPDSQGQGAWFLTSDLAKAKGNNPKDFAKNWKNISSNIDWSNYEIPPQVIKLEGEHLQTFKKLFSHYTGKTLPASPSILVCNWTAAYGYLVQGNSAVSQKAQSLGSAAIETSVKTAVSNNVVSITERILHDQLALLFQRTPRRIRIEYVIADTLRSRPTTRRFDLVEYHNSRSVTIYEIKKDAITPEDVMETVGRKGYLTLAKGNTKFAKKKIRLAFVSPHGILPEAERLLAEMKEVSFIHLHQLVNNLLQEATQEVHNECPSQAGWYLREKLVKEFPAIIPDSALQLLAAA